MAEDISSGSLKVTGSVYVPFYGLILTLDILVKEKKCFHLILMSFNRYNDISNFRKGIC